MLKSHHLHPILFTASALCLSLSLNVFAQDQNSDDESYESLVLEEVIVTATKREAALVDIASAINVFDSSLMNDLRLRNVRDFVELTPGAAIQESAVGITTDISLRGVGTPGDLVEPGVGIYVDEMYAGGLRTVLPEAYDLQRVEVLRGTQAGLYGRNAVGGAFLYITGQPTDQLEGQAEFRYGRYDLAEVSGTINTPISDTAALRFTGWYRNQDDGEITEQVSGTALADHKQYGGRVSGRFDFGESAVLSLVYEHTQRDAFTGQSFYIDGTPTIVGALEDSRNVYRDTDSHLDTQNDRFTGKMTWDSGIGTWTAVLGYRTYELDALEDQDFSARNYLEVDPGTLTMGTFSNRELARQEKIDSTYAEIRLASDNGNSAFSWLAGLNYFKEDGDFDMRQIAKPPLLGGFNIFLPVPPFNQFFTEDDVRFDRFVSLKTESWSAFITMDWALSDRWTLSGGGRYTDDSKDSDYTLDVGIVTSVLTGAVPFSATPSESFSNLSPEIALMFRVSDDWNVYGRIASGFRAGGINVLISDPDLFKYDEETSINYEIGAKGSLFDGRGSLALTGFILEREDVLLGFSPAPLQFALQNAGESRSYGVEIEFAYLVTDGFTLGANLGFYDSEITQVDPGFPAEKGNQIPNLPDTTFSLLANYRRPVTSGMDLLWSANYRYRTGGYLETMNVVEMPSYSLLNLTLGVGGEHWTLLAYADNVLDDTYQLTTLPFILSQTLTSLAPPPAYETFSGRSDFPGATYGIRLIATF